MDGDVSFNVSSGQALKLSRRLLAARALCTGTGARPRESRPEFRTGPSVVQRFPCHSHLLCPSTHTLTSSARPPQSDPEDGRHQTPWPIGATKQGRGGMHRYQRYARGGRGVCESIHRCLIWKRAGNFKSGAAPQPMLEFSCFPVSLASGPRSLAVFFGSPGRQPDGESNCQRPGPPSWQSRTSVFCFIVPVKCRLSRCGSVCFNCRGRCEGGSPSDEVLAVANIRPPVTGSSCTAASPKGRLGRWCTATPLRMSRPSRTGRASSGNASTPLSAAGFHSD